MSAQREFDVVVFGATGFTGGLIGEYLAKHASDTPEDAARWAIAGRNPARLAEVADYLKTLNPACASIGMITADDRDQGTLVAMTRRTKVVLSTVGPYVEHGQALVRACIEGGADYADITGEPEFVDGVIEDLGARAEEAGVRIVHCCGFDSIPHDLGVFYTVEQLPENEPIELAGYVRVKGTPSGGTWQSAILAMGRMREAEKQKAARKAEKPRPASGTRRIGRLEPRFGYRRELGGWAFPLPTIDPQIIARSARTLERYGPDFRYAHYGISRSLPLILAGAAGLGLLFVMAQFAPAREYLRTLRKSGQGPGAEERATNWFEVTFVGRSRSKSIKTRVSGGDPGYSETAKMAAEAALCLARDPLPERAGVLTTAAAMGDALLERLQKAGIRFEVIG